MNDWKVPMISGLVVTHGGFGEELVRVVEMILGPVEGLTAISNRGLSARELEQRIAAATAAVEPQSEVLLFIDDLAGSCAGAARLAARNGAQALIITGVNLAMLLDFSTWRESLELPELARRLVEKGREAISLIDVGKEG